MFVSAVSLSASVALMILFVGMRDAGVHMAYAHMGVAALMAFSFAVKFFVTDKALRAANSRESAIAANTARYTGYVAAWATACLLTVYGTSVLIWREWATFTIACALLAGLCILFSSMLQRDADAGHDDPGLLKLANGLAIVLLVGMAIAIVGFAIDGKMTRFLNPRFTDWAANNVFFFGALALAAISGHALKNKGVRG